MRIALLLGLAVTSTLAGHGLLTMAGGGSGWSSDAERVVFGLLQVLAAVAMAAGLLISPRTPRLGVALVAAGVVGISIVWYWFLIVTIPVGLGLIAIAFLRGRDSDERTRIAGA